MLNPFDQTQYSISAKIGGTFDPNPLYSGGVPSLIASLRDAVRLRQEAVRLGYLDGVAQALPSPPSLASLLTQNHPWFRPRS